MFDSIECIALDFEDSRVHYRTFGARTCAAEYHRFMCLISSFTSYIIHKLYLTVHTSVIRLLLLLGYVGNREGC